MPRLTPATERLKRGDHRIAALPSRREPIPDVPSGIDANLWETVYREAPHLTARDARLVAMLCRLLDDAVELRSIIETEGRFTVGARGSQAAHPAVRQLRDAETSILAVSSALVLTPLARSRAAVPDAIAPASRVEGFRERLTQIGTEAADSATTMEARPRAARPAASGAPSSLSIPPEATTTATKTTKENRT